MWERVVIVKRHGRRASRVLVVVALCTCVGCAAMSAAQVGQAAGTIAGSAIVPGIGGPVGGLIGMLAGLVVDHQVDKVREKQEHAELSQELQRTTASPSAPSASVPNGHPTRVWVDEQVMQGRVSVGHFEVRTLPG